MSPERQRAVAVWVVLVLGGVGGFVVVSVLAGRLAWETLVWYAGVVGLTAAAGVFPGPGEVRGADR